MRIGVLALQGAVSEHIEAIKKLGFEAIPVKRKEELETIDGLIFPGGESTTIGRLLKKYELDIVIRNLISQGLPVYGTCAGMILLSKRVENYDQFLLEALDVTIVRNAFGRQIDSMEADLEIKGFDKTFHAVFIRAPVAKEAGQQVEVLSSLEEGIVFVKERNILASSFHSELGEDLRIHKMFIDMIYRKI